MISAGTRKLVHDAVPLASLVGGPQAPPRDLPADGELVTSRFALIRREGSTWIAESSLAAAAVVLEDPRAHAVLAAFAVPRAPDGELAERVGLPAQVVSELASLLHVAGVLVDVDQAREEDEPPLAFWEFHDLLFHARSRAGRQRARAGGTYRFSERFDSVPALPAARSADTIELERPDYDRLLQDDPPFAHVQEIRASIREYGRPPLTLTQLSEFLYRVGRVNDFWEFRLPGSGSKSMSFAARPYPSGGANYELEVYVVARDCEGLESGLYHYDAGSHRLGALAGYSDDVAELIARAATGMASDANSMQSLLTITARFARVAWKYESIAYALVLKDVGVLLQTMYLSATAMGLAPCAIGSGDSDLFAAASGIDYYEETAVGEFALGSPRR